MPAEEEGCAQDMHDEALPVSECERTEQMLSFEEILRLAKIFVSLGVSKIRLTGGEPLVRRNIVSLVARLAELPGLQTLGMTTNGVLLSRYARVLKRAGLSNLNISLDTLRADRFLRIAKRPHFDRVLEGIDAALHAGFSPLKLNVVVMGGINDDEIPDFAELAHSRPIHVRFIEYMPFRFNSWSTASFVSWQDIIERLAGFVDWSRAKPGHAEGSVAKEYEIDGWLGRIGFITSMSDHFCASCNRLRLTADGSVKSCLFHPAELNLRSALRASVTDEELEVLIRSAVLEKPRGHAPVDELVAMENRSMIEIGG